MRILFFLIVGLCLGTAHAATMCMPDYSASTVSCGSFTNSGSQWSAVCGDIAVSGVVVQTPYNVGDVVPSNRIENVDFGTGCYGLIITKPVRSEYVLIHRAGCYVEIDGFFDYFGGGDCGAAVTLGEFFSVAENYSLKKCAVK